MYACVYTHIFVSILKSVCIYPTTHLTFLCLELLHGHLEAGPQGDLDVRSQHRVGGLDVDRALAGVAWAVGCMAALVGPAGLGDEVRPAFLVVVGPVEVRGHPPRALGLGGRCGLQAHVGRGVLGAVVETLLGRGRGAVDMSEIPERLRSAEVVRQGHVLLVAARLTQEDLRQEEYCSSELHGNQENPCTYVCEILGAAWARISRRFGLNLYRTSASMAALTGHWMLVNGRPLLRNSP